MDAFLTACEKHGWTIFWLVLGLVFVLNNVRWNRCCCRRNEDDEDEN